MSVSELTQRALQIHYGEGFWTSRDKFCAFPPGHTWGTDYVLDATPGAIYVKPEANHEALTGGLLEAEILRSE